MSIRWGKAGQRLTAQEVAERDRSAVGRRNKDRIRRDEELAAAYQLWRAGQVVPHRITLALDADGLNGPEVDEACGAQEPDVDLWETGERYPTWEQVLALAELTGKTPRFFMDRDVPRDRGLSTLRFHVKDYEPPPLPVVRFTAEAVAATVDRA